MNAVRFLLVFGLTAALAGCATPGNAPPPQPLPAPEIQAPPKMLNGSIYQSGHDVRLYEDRITRRVGDLITVIFEERTQAAKDASTNISKDQDISIGVPVILGEALEIGGRPLSASASAGRQFQGAGEADQNNLFQGVLTSQVVAVQPNGNMVIQGQKKITLNRGDEYITLTGVVRREDVRADNTISSTRIANAQIAYTGSGAMADANTMGWLSRVFYSVIWPF